MASFPEIVDDAPALVLERRGRRTRSCRSRRSGCPSCIVEIEATATLGRRGVSAPAPPTSRSPRSTAAIAAGELSAVELAQAYLERIDAFDAALNVYRTRHRASWRSSRRRRSTRRRGAGRPLGPLAGVPVALKDNIAVARRADDGRARGTCAGDRAPTQDAPVYERLRARGRGAARQAAACPSGRSAGRTRTSTTATSTTRGTRRGSAAAPAAARAPRSARTSRLATLGTDTGGSVRIPAALNGCCGLRPTAGRVSNRGLDPGGVDLRHDRAAGAPGRGRRGDAGRHRGLRPRGPRHRRRPGRRLRGGLGAGRPRPAHRRAARRWQDERSTPAFARAPARTAAAQLEGLGAELEEVELAGLDEAIEWTAELLLAEAAWFHRERLRDCPEIFAPTSCAGCAGASRSPAPHYGRGRQWQRAWRRRVLAGARRAATCCCARAPRGPRRWPPRASRWR